MAHIFVIDDDEQLLRMVGLMLERGGHTVTLMSNPVIGLEQIKQELPDMVILDVMMPGMSGHDVCRAIRAHGPTRDVPIMILTARAQEVDRQTAMQGGADDYLSKPVTSQELLTRVEALLKRRQSSKPLVVDAFVIGVFGLSGGVGRTTLAVNLATALRAETQGDVCLVDFTNSGGQAAMHLRLQPRTGWMNFVSVDTLDWNVVHDELVLHSSGVQLLAGPTMPQSSERPIAEMATAILELLRQKMMFIVVDLGPVFNDALKTTLATSDMALHVISPDIVSVQTAVRTERALRNSGVIMPNRSYILNQIAAEPQLSKATVERGLHTRVPFHITYDPNQPRALAQGTPLTLSTAQSSLPETMREMAAALWEKVTTDSDSTPGKPVEGQLVN